MSAIMSTIVNTNSVPTFRERLDFLFRTRLSPDANPFTLRQAEAETGISRAYLHKLRTAEANPTLDVVLRLSRFFEVPPSYFYDDAEFTGYAAQMDQRLARLTEHPLAVKLALVALALPDEAMRWLLRLAKREAAAQEGRS